MARGRGAKPRHIDPGCPWQNAYGESFNGKLRDECLDLELFANRREAAVILEAWRHSYNTQRPHSSLGYQTPREFRSGLTRGEGSGPDGPLSRIDPGEDLAILVPAASVGATLIPLASLLAGGRPASMIVAVSLILIVALAVRLLAIKIPHAIPGRAGGKHGAARDAADRPG